MRIRKAVPEGYKTGAHGTIKSSIGLDVDQFSSLCPSNQSNSWEGGSDSGESLKQTSASFAELAPFCGILKVGNLAQQASFHATEDYSLQESTDSSLPVGTMFVARPNSFFGHNSNPNKQRFSDNDGE